MARPETRIAWVCEDGAEFDSELAAEQHETKIALIADLESSDIYWRDCSTDEVAAWLLSNYTIVKKDQ